MSPSRNAATSSGIAKTGKGKVTAKTESQTLAADNEARVALYVTNNGANAVWLAYGSAAGAEEGIMLAAEVGSVVIDDYTGVVSVITKTGESLVTFSEV